MPNGKNVVTLQGQAITIRVTPKVAFITMYIRGYREPNFPRVVVFKPELIEKVKELPRHTHITVEASIRERHLDSKNPNASSQSIIAHSIEPTESSMMTEFGIETTQSFKPYENKVALTGTLVGMESSSRGPTYVTIRTYDEVSHRYGNVRTVYYGDAKKLSERLRLNDTVAVRGIIQTHKSVKDKPDGNPDIRYYENCVVSEILPIEAEKEIERLKEPTPVTATVKFV